MNGVTAGIDAIASTRVLICEENYHATKNAYSGQAIQRKFRCVLAT